jgi:hypothetical protein
MKFNIKNFTDADVLGVEGTAQKFIGDTQKTPLVSISQDGGSMRLYHSMRPDQARFMASALQLAADQAEQAALGNVVEAAE